MVHLLLVHLLAGSAALAQGQSPADLTGHWQLFVDDHVIASKAAVTRRYQAFKKYAGNPVLAPNRPWEGSMVYVYGSVLPAEGGGYRMWYHSLPRDQDANRLLYATSVDGVQWTKPNLGLVAYNGSTANNIFLRRSGKDHIPSIIYTPWEENPALAYKLVNFDGVAGQFLGATSPDGIHWTDVASNPIVPPASDVGNFIWDPHTERYAGYLKVPAYVSCMRRRAVGFSATTDFGHWPAAELIFAPDVIDDAWATGQQRTHFYGLCGFAYESMYLGFVWVFRATDSTGYNDGTIHVELVSSRDGITWQRQEGARSPLLALGAPGSWDDGMLFTTQHPLVEGDTIRLWYGGCDSTHAAPMPWGCAIGMATLRKDGFVSLDAGAAPGSVTTHLLQNTGGALRVNCTVRGGGWLKAEVLDASGAVWPGYTEAECIPFTGDAVDAMVTWQGRSALPETTSPLRLRFRLKDASLYSFHAGLAELALPPVVLQQPQSTRCRSGGFARFRVRAAGAGPITYQWQKQGENLADSARVTGTMTETLTITDAASSDVAMYRCIVRDGVGETISAEAGLTLQSATLTAIGRLPGMSSSSVNSITPDGSVVCGVSGTRAFIWSPTHGLVNLGVPSGASTSNAAGVTLDSAGSLVVAVDTNASTNRARRWSGERDGSGAYTTLPRGPASAEWTVRGIGGDMAGDVWIAGSTLSGGDGNGRMACRYRASTSEVARATLPQGGHDHSDLWAASDIGTFAGQYQYGGTSPSGGTRQAMHIGAQLEATALESIIGPPGSSTVAVAKTISRDGTVLGGFSYYQAGSTLLSPAIWTGSKALQLPMIIGGDNDNYGEILALSGDGSVAGGYSYYEGGAVDGPREALIWDAENCTRRLHDVLVNDYGVNLTGWTLSEVRAISADGDVIAGVGVRSGVIEGWVAHLTSAWPRPPSVIVPPASSAAIEHSTIALTVTAQDPAALRYSWRKHGVPLRDGARFQGTSTPALIISGVTPLEQGEYTCLVSSPTGWTLAGPANLSVVLRARADFDLDGDVDQTDFAHLQACLSGSWIPQTHPECVNARLDGDLDVDAADVDLFFRCMSGAGVEADVNCIR